MAIFLLSCSSVGRMGFFLADIESVIDEYPDSALVLLESVDPKEIQSDKDQAKYSLLLAMAYDKNHIDVQSDSLILPALKYYVKRGSPDERLKTLYYRGLVERNKGNSEQAMVWYVKALRYADKAEDRTMAGRLCTTMMIAYNKVFDIESSIRMADMARKYYLEASDTSRYISSVLNMVSACIQQRDTLAAHEYLNHLTPYGSLMTGSQKLVMFLKKMSISKDLEGFALTDIYNLLKLGDICYNEVDWLMVTGKYCDFGDFDSAYFALEHYRSYNETYASLYHWYHAQICESLGRYKEAAEAYRSYSILTDDSDIVIFGEDTKFIEERYNSELIAVRQRLMLIIAALSISLLMFLCILIIRILYKMSKEKTEEREKMEKMYAELLEEQGRLKRARRDTALGKNVRLLVDHRLAVLNKFILAHISGMYSKEAVEELSKLIDDREYFLESTRISFIIAHPQFLMFLKQYDLSDWEIACCCMYCIGLNGSEISGYLKRKSYYNDSSVIRKKLGLDRNVNIDSFLRKKLSELDNKNSTI